MKKLLYLFLAITVACSSGDDSSDNQNNTSGKKLTSINILNPCIWCEAEFGDYGYTNGKLTSVEGGTILTDENGEYQQGYPSEDYYIIEHLSNSIRINEDGYTDTFPINGDGTIMSDNIDFDEGYIQRSDDTYFSWSNGNLIETSSAGEAPFVIEYSDFDDLTGHLGITIATGYIDFTLDNIYSITGLIGNSTDKLPYSVTRTRPDCTWQKIYTYLFDDDGYPIQVVKDYNETCSDGTTYNSSRRFQLTYE